jgi:threonine/homoserine/homoserine lactone efflux protein
MLLNILKAFLIGICASAPIGPIAILVMQKSLSYGQEAGFVTGLGATLVDTLYAVISIFALAIAQQFLETYEYPIYIAGGLIVGVLGYTMAFRDPSGK